MPAPVTAPPRAPGRPRSARAEQAIQEAAIDLFVEQGFDAMSMEGVAARAGVGKTTIYRRWDSKEDLVMDAVGVCQLNTVVDPDTGSLREDLVRVLTAFQQTVRNTPLGHVFPRMVAEVAQGSDLGRLYASRMIEPRRRMLLSIVQRGVGRGELPLGADMELSLELIMGPVILRRLFGNAPARGNIARCGRHVDVVLAGLRDLGGR